MIFKIIKISLLVILMETMFSCAIHAKFPFFCFKKECIINAWSPGRKEAGGKRSLKQKVKILSANLKKKKKNKKKGNKNFDKKVFEDNKEWIDSLSFEPKSGSEYIKIIMFMKEGSKAERLMRDSFYIKSSFLLLSKNDRIAISYYLELHQLKRIKEIHITSSSCNENVRSALMKKKRIQHYIIIRGVRKSRVIILK